MKRFLRHLWRGKVHFTKREKAILREAVAVIETRGWWDGGRVYNNGIRSECALTAIQRAGQHDPAARHRLIQKFARWLYTEGLVNHPTGKGIYSRSNSITMWNDRSTEDIVLGAMRRAAG